MFQYSPILGRSSIWDLKFTFSLVLYEFQLGPENCVVSCRFSSCDSLILISTRAFLQRNIHQCPRETKVLCYKTLLRPVVEYASIIWDPHTNANINRLEIIQRRYARFVFHDYRRSSSVTAMLDQLHWASLQERRAQARLK